MNDEYYPGYGEADSQPAQAVRPKRPPHVPAPRKPISGPLPPVKRSEQPREPLPQQVVLPYTGMIAIVFVIGLVIALTMG